MLYAVCDLVRTQAKPEQQLLARGWTEADCAALAGGNLLRALRDAESFAVRH